MSTKSGTTDETRTKIVPVHSKMLQRKKKKRKRKVTAKGYALTHEHNKIVEGKTVAWLPA